MILSEIISYFTNVKANADGSYNADCPVCSSKHANSRHLKITPVINSEGKSTVMMACAKCQNSTDKILSAVGLTYKDLYENSRQYEIDRAMQERRTREAQKAATAKATQDTSTNIAQPPKDDWQAIGEKQYLESRCHIYEDVTSGKAVLVKEIKPYIITERNSVTGEERQTRHKEAFWKHLTESGKWENGQGDYQPALYHCSAMLQAKQSGNGNILFIVEGEKDVETMERLGFTPATTLPNGAGATKWIDAYNAVFKDVKNVIILTDNDEAGRGYGQFVAKNVAGIVGNVYIVPCEKLLDGLQEKGDISDIATQIGDNATAHKLVDVYLECCNGSEKWKYTPPVADPAATPPPQTQQAGNTRQQAEKPALDFVDADALEASEEQKGTFLWKPYIPLKEVTILAAGCGKGKGKFYTRVVADLSKGRQLPTEYEDRVIMRTEGQRSLILSAEEDRGELCGQFNALDADVSKIFICDTVGKVGADGQVRQSTLCSNYNLTDKIGDLEALIKWWKPALVVIDPIETFMGKDINMLALNEVTIMMRDAVALAKRCECAMLMVAHLNKRENVAEPMNAITGSAGFANCARSVLTIEEYDKEDTKICVQLKVSHAKKGKSILFTVHSGNNDFGIADWGELSEVTPDDIVQARRNGQSIEDYMQRFADRNENDCYVMAEIRDYIPEDGKKKFIAYEQIEHIEDRQGKSTILRIAQYFRNEKIILTPETSSHDYTDDDGNKRKGKGFSIQVNK